MAKFIISFLLFLYFNLNSQKSVNDFYTFDTIISTNIKVNFKDFNESNYNLFIRDSILFIYNISYKENDSFHFKVLNLNNYSITDLRVYQKSLSDKIKSPFLKFYSIDNNFITIVTSFNNLIVYDRNSSNKLILDTTFEECSYEGMKVIDSNIYLYSTYNHHPKSCNQNTRLTIFNIHNKKIDYDTFLNNPFKEFTHFSPNRLIAISKKGEFYFTNSIDAKIYIINNRRITSFDLKTDSNWLQFKPQYLIAFNKLNKEYAPHKLIDFLSPFEDSVSRIEQINFINDSILHIVKIPKYNKKYNRIRFHDFYNTFSKNSILTNLVEKQLNKNEIITKTNIPLLSSESQNNLFEGNYYVNFVPSSSIPELGNSIEGLNLKLENYNSSEFTYKIKIFKFKK